jgi:hypothetical protein
VGSFHWLNYFKRVKQKGFWQQPTRLACQLQKHKFSWLGAKLMMFSENALGLGPIGCLSFWSLDQRLHSFPRILSDQHDDKLISGEHNTISSFSPRLGFALFLSTFLSTPVRFPFHHTTKYLLTRLRVAIFTEPSITYAWCIVSAICERTYGRWMIDQWRGSGKWASEGLVLPPILYGYRQFSIWNRERSSFNDHGLWWFRKSDVHKNFSKIKPI